MCLPLNLKSLLISHVTMGDRMNRSLSAAYRELGEDLNSSALIAELRAVRNIHSECIFISANIDS